MLAEVVAYLLVLTNVMGNWWLVLATGVIALALPAFGRAVRPEAFRVTTAVPAPDRERTAGAMTMPVDGVAAVEGVADARP